MSQFVLHGLISSKREARLGILVLHLCAYFILLEGILYQISYEINSHNLPRKNNKATCSHANKDLKQAEMTCLVHKEVCSRAGRWTQIVEGPEHCRGDSAILQHLLSFSCLL